MKIGERLGKIRRQLDEARRTDLRPFGVEGHEWKLNSPIQPDALQAIEEKYSVILPSEYREFILNVGDGGAGPYWGLLPLREAIVLHRLNPSSDPGVLSQEFPNVGSFNPEDDPFWVELEGRLGRGEISEAEFDSHLDRDTAGTLAICHEGCGYLHRLVVSGPDRGRVWMDATCTEQGLSPMGLTFLEWYEQWLLQALEGNRCL